MTTGEKIKQKRLQLGWTLCDLADKIGYSNHSTVARIETGVIDVPKSKLKKFADVLGVPVEYLIG